MFGGEGMASFLIEFGAVIVRFQARQQQSDGLVSSGQVSFGQVSFGQFFNDHCAKYTSALAGQFEDGRVGLRRAKRPERTKTGISTF